jgi:hypothetical protein
MSLKAQLAKAKSLWSKAKDMKPEFESSVTDGVYVGRISLAELGESQASGRLQVSWGVVISAGEFKGETVRWWSGLKTEQNFMYLQRDIARLGKDVPEGVDELEDILAAIEKEKPSIRFRVKTDGEFQNVRILKLLTGADATEDEDGGETAPEDPEPEAEEPEVAPDAEPEPEPEPEDEPTLDVGVRAAFDLAGKEVAGEVVKVGEADATIKLDDGRKFKFKLEKLRPAAKTKVKKK